VADDLAFPNGLVVTPENATLIVAESFARRLTALGIIDRPLERKPVRGAAPGRDDQVPEVRSTGSLRVTGGPFGGLRPIAPASEEDTCPGE
jgi:sugar lactone lactonase YvrE